MSIVYVIAKDGTPLMPTIPVIARLLLKAGKAKVKRRTPFTIKLLYETTKYTQPLTLGLDTGSTTIATAVVDEEDEIVYVSEIRLRTDIKDKMDRRRMYRRTRRSRKLRYRPARFLNRKNSIKKGRYPPTIRSKIMAHIKELSFVFKLLPITKIRIESGSFDPHLLKDPSLAYKKWNYSKGPLYQYSNFKEYIKVRDKYTCQNCKGKSKDKHLEVHHIIYKSNGGNDDLKNLILLCKTCHNKVHSNIITLSTNVKRAIYKDATHMNIILNVVVAYVKRLFPNTEETYGYITNTDRQNLGLDKEHYLDAIVIATEGRKFKTKVSKVLYKKCIADGRYQCTWGIRSEKKYPKGKIGGFNTYDKIKYRGKEYFIKGRISTGYFKICNILGNTINIKPMAKPSTSIRMSAKKSWVMTYINE